MANSWSLAQIGDQGGRVAIVTGANTGLGYETALALAGKGARVVLACRHRERAEEARDRIRSRHPSAELEVRLIDTGSLGSVRRFAEEFKRDHDRLDLLINNAGIMITPYFRTEDGFEGQLGVNYLGHFLLTGLLMPRITGTAGSRIVSLYSVAAGWGGMHFEDIHFEERYDARRSYSQSKMACLMFALELNQRLRRAGLEAISLAAHPGFSRSELSRNMPLHLRLFVRFTAPFLLQSSAAGALPTLFAALGPDLKGGEAIGPSRRRETRGPPTCVEALPEAVHQSSRDRLWRLSEELCGFRYEFVAE